MVSWPQEYFTGEGVAWPQEYFTGEGYCEGGAASKRNKRYIDCMADAYDSRLYNPERKIWKNFLRQNVPHCKELTKKSRQRVRRSPPASGKFKSYMDCMANRYRDPNFNPNQVKWRGFLQENRDICPRKTPYVPRKSVSSNVSGLTLRELKDVARSKGVRLTFASGPRKGREKPKYVLLQELR